MAEPIQAEYREMMKALASAIDDVLNGNNRRPGVSKKFGFALFMFEFEKIEPGRVNYISNAKREDMLIAVREWLARAEGRIIDAGSKQ